MNGTNAFCEAAEQLAPRLRMALRQVPKGLWNDVQEIRLRLGCPVSVCTHRGVHYLTQNGVSTQVDAPGQVCASREDLAETVSVMCSYSVYTHQNELRDGFIALRGGHRAGICGSAVLEGERITSVRDISSINIRLGRQLIGCADRLMADISDDIADGVLLSGAPGSGKTTLLRDMIRTLSREGHRVVVVDERGEIGASYLGERGNDLGPNCDLMCGYPKAEGIVHAIRGLSPEIVVCDELGGESDVRAIAQGLHAGVSFIATIHAGTHADLLRKRHIQQLLYTDAFASVVLLGDRRTPGSVQKIYKAGDLIDTDNGRDFPRGSRDGHWLHRIEASRPTG